MQVLSCPDLQFLSMAIEPTPESRAAWHAQWSFDSDDDSGKDKQPCSLLPLQQLSCLTGLALWGCYRLQDDHLSQLAALSRLHSLKIYDAGPITDKGLRSLTQLAALSVLQVDGFSSLLYPRRVSNAVVPDEEFRLFLHNRHLKVSLQSTSAWCC